MLYSTSRRALVWTLPLALLAAGLVFASAARVGVTQFGTLGGGAGVRFPKAAYGTTPDVYLVVHGQGGITGRFFSADGVPIGGQFLITANPNAIAPTVTYSQLRNVFFVAWLEERPAGVVVTGRVLGFGGGGPQFLTGMFDISGGGAKFLDAAPTVAYSSLSDVFLVAWSSMDGGLEVLAQRVLHTGQPLGGPIPIGVTPGIWELYPSVAYNSNQDEFFVVFTSEKEGVAFPFRTAGTRVLADSGTSFPPVMLYEAEFNNYPEVAYNSNANEYLAISYVNSGVLGVGGGDVLGRRVNGSGQPIGPVLPVGATPGFEGGDGIGLAFNAKTNSYLAVFQGVGDLTHASEVMANGAVHPVFMAMTGNPTYQPKVAADPERGRWLIVNSTGFTQSSVQLIASSGAGPIAPAPPPPPPPPGPNPTAGLPPVEDINLSGGSHAPNGSWYFAEGAKSGPPLNFKTFYLISNPHSQAVDVRAYFSNENGVSYRTDYTVAARSRLTVWLPDALPNGAYGAVFQSKEAGRQVYVERSMYWGPNFEGSHTETGARDLQTTQYLAEGSRKGEFFRNYLLLFNPTSSTVNVDVTFYRTVEHTIGQSYQLGPQERRSIDLGTIPELANRDFGMRIQSSAGIVAERSMYWGPSWMGGTNSMASPLATGWLFAEGATAPGFQTFYLMLNPHGIPVDVWVSYMKENAVNPPTKKYTLQPRSRLTIHLNGQLGNVGGVGGRIVSGGAPILVERAIYWGNGSWADGHSDVGVSNAGKVWFLPEGTTNAGFDTYTLIANPGNGPVTLNITVYLENHPGNPQQTLARTVGARQRLTIPMRQFLAQAFGAQNANNKNFSTRVSVAGSTPGGNVVVEHAIYKQPDGANFWRAGGAAMALRE